MRKASLQATGIMLVALLVSGCAAILNGSHSKLNVDSDPQGAKVYDNGSPVGVTPVELNLEKKKDHTIEFRKSGYESMTKVVSSSAGAGWVVCDILLTGVIGVVIDATTNSWNGLDDQYVKVALEATKLN